MSAAYRAMLVGIEGNDYGRGLWAFFGTLIAKYKRTLAAGDKLTAADVTYSVSGMYNKARIVSPMAPQTADWNTKTLGHQIDYATDPTQNTPYVIVANTQANPTVVTTLVKHNLMNGQKIRVANNVGSNAAINGDHVATVIDDYTFSLPVDCTVAGGTGGTFIRLNSLDGAVGVQQVKAITGFTGVVGKILTSPDDTTHTTLITFTNVTPADVRAGERLEVAGTVDQFSAYLGDTTGAGSVTLLAAIARK